MSDEETKLLNLFDFYWFEYGVFSEKPPLSTLQTSPVREVQEEEEEVFGKMMLNPVKTLMRRSFSDQFLSSKDCSDSMDSPSPDSVLIPQLQTILSGKEIEEFPELTLKKQEYLHIDFRNGFETSPNGSFVYLSQTEPTINKGKKMRKRMRREGSGKSLTELEFEEVKGFMDLGFVFSDEDKDSRLVSIIPGLQRLGKNITEGSDKGFVEVSVSRPYLSEA